MVATALVESLGIGNENDIFPACPLSVVSVRGGNVHIDYFVTKQHRVDFGFVTQHCD